MRLSSSVSYFIWLLIVLLFSACDHSKSEQRYLYLSHTYDWPSAATNDKIDPRVAALPLSEYNQVWLGGDLCSRSSEKVATLHYLDSIFGFSQQRAHWSLGNHDLVEGDRARIEQVIQKPSFYTQWQNGLVVLVLDTNFNHPQHGWSGGCAGLEEQYQLIQHVCDTIQEASHLIILHHHVLLTNTIAQDQIDLRTIYHYYEPNLQLRCEPSETFESGIYPQLVAVQRKGVEVILIGGDIGMRAKQFEFQTKDGITFLGAGINGSLDPQYAPEYVTNFNPDSVLVFTHQPGKERLSWKFMGLEALLTID